MGYLMLIVVAGTPGTGKSSLASLLTRKLNIPYNSLTEIILYKGAWCEYDWRRRSFLIDPPVALRAVSEWVRDKGSLLLETHDVELLWEAGLEPYLVIVLRTRPSILYTRLSRRGWPRAKIVENLEAELVGVVAIQAREYYGERRVCEIDTSTINPIKVLAEAMRAITGSTCDRRIDWLGFDEEVAFVSRLSLGT